MSKDARDGPKIRRTYFCFPNHIAMTDSSLNRTFKTTLEPQRVRAVLFDMDGVIYVGDRVLPGVPELLEYLDRTGRKWLLVTNNASKTSAQFVEKLAKMGIRARPEQVLGSAEAAAGWLAEQVQHHNWPTGKVIMLGEEGLRYALTQQGFELTLNPEEATYAVAGINFHLTYEDLARVALAIRQGARFIGTNSDPSYPSERGLLPGAGSLLAALATATDVPPIVIGKPNRGMYEQAMRRLNVESSETMMVGDRYNTDIEGALGLGMWACGILTGVSKRADFESAPRPPHCIAADLPELLRLLEG